MFYTCIGSKSTTSLKNKEIVIVIAISSPGTKTIAAWHDFYFSSWHSHQKKKNLSNGLQHA